jgi:hypothetical protein
MEFWLVVGLVLGVVLVWAAISDRRDRRYHRLRSHSEMADDHREHLRDVRAADMGSHLNPDTLLDASSRFLPATVQARRRLETAMMTGTRVVQRSRRVRFRRHGKKKRASMGAYSGHPAKRFGLLLLVLGIVGVVVAACGGNDASPTASSGSSPPPTSATSGTRTSDTLSRGEVARLFDYDRRRPLAITKLGSYTGRVPAEQLDGVTIHSITYASPKGGEVPALVVVPKGKGPFPGVIVQHGLPDTKEGMLPAGIDLARTGPLQALPAQDRERWLQAMRPIEPINFIG